MRVLHTIPGLAPRYGGPSIVIGSLCPALNRLSGLSVEILTTDADGLGGRLVPSATPGGLKTHMFGVTLSDRWKFSAGLWGWISRHARDYDVIHVHALWSFATAAVSAAARHAGVPYLLRPAGMLSSYTWSRVAYRKQLYWNVVERRSVYGASCFHATSSGEAREIESARPGAKTFVIPNGVDAAAWQAPSDAHALRRLCGPAAANRPIVLFMSRLHPKKGVVDFLLPAFAQQKSDAFLAIAGSPDEHAPHYSAEVKRAIERLRLADRVAMLGPIPPDSRWSLYDGAAVFVLPSHSENFGLVVTEAMARGCPVIVSENTYACEHVKVARAGRVVPLTVSTLASTLDELLGDVPLCRELGRNGQEYARANLSWDRIAAQVVDMYAECLSQPVALTP